MTQKVKVGDYDATVLETVEQFNNVVDSTPNYKWLLWSRQVNQETFGPMFILLRYTPTHDLKEAIKYPAPDRFWYAVSIDVLYNGKKDVVYRGAYTLDKSR